MDKEKKLILMCHRVALGSNTSLKSAAVNGWQVAFIF